MHVSPHRNRRLGIDWTGLCDGWWDSLLEGGRVYDRSIKIVQLITLLRTLDSVYLGSGRHIVGSCQEMLLTFRIRG